MNRKKQVAKYIIADLVSAIIAWVLFYLFRKKIIEPQKFGYDIPFKLDEPFYYGLVLIPLFWLALYGLFGMYKNIYRRHRLRELGQVLLASMLGVVILFFLVLLDDEIASYVYYYKSLLVLFLLHFTFTFGFRIVLTTQSVKAHTQAKTEL